MTEDVIKKVTARLLLLTVIGIVVLVFYLRTEMFVPRGGELLVVMPIWVIAAYFGVIWYISGTLLIKIAAKKLAIWREKRKRTD